VLGHVRSVLEQRRATLGPLGCPSAIVTDDILRDEAGLRALVASVFPEASRMESTRHECLFVQDPIHRR
jgi:hypothetical protein